MAKLITKEDIFSPELLEFIEQFKKDRREPINPEVGVKVPIMAELTPEEYAIIKAKKESEI